MVWSDINSFKIIGTRFVIILNKMDLNPYTKPEKYYKEGLISAKNIITTSALNKMNIEALKEHLYNTVIDHPELMDQTIVSNTRHYDALNKSCESLSKVLNGIQTGITGDFIALDIRQSLHFLGEITGEIHTDDLLESIFTRFCIGK